MSARIALHPNADPMEVWPGVAALDRRGVEIANDMLVDLEETEADSLGGSLGNLSCLEDWPRAGLPHRNVVAERLEIARQAGAEAESAFLAVLSDFIGLCAQGNSPNMSRYWHLYELDEADDGGAAP